MAQKKKQNKPLKLTMTTEEFRSFEGSLPKSSAGNETALESDIHTMPASDYRVVSWNGRWADPEVLADFHTPLQLRQAEIKQRLSDLKDHGFKVIQETNGAPRGATMLEKTHHKILRERHQFTPIGLHSRRLEVVGASRLRLLTSKIKAITNKTLAENKGLSNGIQWSAWRDRVEFGPRAGKNTSNEKLAALLRKYWDLIQSLQIYDPLTSDISPIAGGFTLDPLRGLAATDVVRERYLEFLNAVTLASEIVGSKLGRPRRPDPKTQKNHLLAEAEYRHLFEIDRYQTHSERCDAVSRLLIKLKPNGISITGKTLQKVLRHVWHELEKKNPA